MRDVVDIYKEYEYMNGDSLKLEMQALIYIDNKRNRSF